MDRRGARPCTHRSVASTMAASTMSTTMGAPPLDDGMESWLEAVGLKEWCKVFKDELGLDHIDDLGTLRGVRVHSRPARVDAKALTVKVWLRAASRGRHRGRIPQGIGQDEALR